jgi:hypothetical protein
LVQDEPLSLRKTNLKEDPCDSPSVLEFAAEAVGLVEVGKRLWDEAPASVSSTQANRAEPTGAGKAVGVADGFAAFWKLYPRRVGRKDAERLYRRARRDGASHDDIIAGLAFSLRTAFEDRDVGYIPYPAKWLRDARWLDLDSADGQPEGHAQPQATILADSGDAAAAWRDETKPDEPRRLVATAWHVTALSTDADAGVAEVLAEPVTAPERAPKPASPAVRPVTEAEFARCASAWNGMARRHGLSEVAEDTISVVSRDGLPRILARFGLAGWQRAIDAIDQSETVRQRIPVSFEWLVEAPDRFARMAR